MGFSAAILLDGVEPKPIHFHVIDGEYLVSGFLPEKRDGFSPVSEIFGPRRLSGNVAHVTKVKETHDTTHDSTHNTTHTPHT